MSEDAKMYRRLCVLFGGTSVVLAAALLAGAVPRAAAPVPPPVMTAPRPAPPPPPVPPPSDPACVLSVESVAVTLGKTSQYRSYADRALITFRLRNSGPATVTAWKAAISIVDPFGAEIARPSLTDAHTSIAPGGTAEAVFGWDDNQFIDGEAYDTFASYVDASITARVASCTVITAQ